MPTNAEKTSIPVHQTAHDSRSLPSLLRELAPEWVRALRAERGA